MTTPQGEVAAAPARADLTKRFLAALIDGVLCAVLALVPVAGALAGAVYVLVRDGLDVEFMRRRSIGKQLMKLRPVRLDGQPMDIPTSVKRNCLFVVGLIGLPFAVIPILGWGLAALLGTVQLVISIVEIVLVVTDPGGRRMGDRLAGTRIVESES